MPRAALLLSLFVLPLSADEKADFEAAVEKLGGVYYDEFPPDDRDRLFEALGGWDHPKAVKAIAEVAGAYGTYLAGLEGRLGAARRAAESTPPHAGRAEKLQELDALEKTYRREAASEHRLISILGGFENRKTIDFALKSLVKSPVWRVRRHLVTACAKWHGVLADEKLTKRLFGTLKKLTKDSEYRVRIAVAGSLSRFQRREALELYELLLKDGDWRVRSAAVQSLAKNRSTESFALLLDTLEHESGRLQDDINKIFRAWTGQSFQFAEQWRAWWRSKGEALPSKAEVRAEQTGGGKPKDGHRFYGIFSRSRHVCYVVDVSGSMEKDVEQLAEGPQTGRSKKNTAVEGKTRLEVAKNELKRAIRNLPSQAYFAIVFFNHDVKPWRKDMTRATPENKAAALKDIDAMVASGTTYTQGALRTAFTMAGAFEAGGRKKGRDREEGKGIDTIFVLSDGGPTTADLDDPQPMEPDPLLETLRQWNESAGIVIHTVAVDTDPEGTYFLENLAKQNGGVFIERK